jgi:hypothetical protein
MVVALRHQSNSILNGLITLILLLVMPINMCSRGDWLSEGEVLSETPPGVIDIS